VIPFEIVGQWRQRPGPMLFYPAMKQMTLDLATAPAWRSGRHGLGAESIVWTLMFGVMPLAVVTSRIFCCPNYPRFSPTKLTSQTAA
jgi:hypothetical protein